MNRWRNYIVSALRALDKIRVRKVLVCVDMRMHSEYPRMPLRGAIAARTSFTRWVVWCRIAGWLDFEWSRTRLSRRGLDRPNLKGDQ